MNDRMNDKAVSPGILGRVGGGLLAAGLLGAGVLGAGVLVGCGNGEPTGSDVRDDIGQAADTTGRFAERQFDEAREWFSSRMSDAERELGELRADAEQLEGDARVRADAAIDDLARQWNALQARMGELRDDGGDAWREVARGMGDAWDEFRASLDRARDEFGG